MNHRFDLSQSSFHAAKVQRIPENYGNILRNIVFFNKCCYKNTAVEVHGF